MGKCVAKPMLETRSINTSESIKETRNYNPFDELVGVKIEKDFHISQISKNLIYNSLSKNHLFRDLNQTDFEAIYKKLIFIVAEENRIIFNQNSIGSLFFIINSGKVEVIVNNKKRSYLSKEECFGEIALLSNSYRRASIKTASKCSFWVLSRDDFFSALKKIYSRSYDKIRKIISSSCFFINFPENKKDQISKLAILHKFEDTEQIIHEGDDGDVLYLLKSGCVSFKKGHEEVLRMSTQGEMFGEAAMLAGSKRLATCIALGTTELISLDKGSMETVFGEDYRNILLKNIVKNAISSDPHLVFLAKSDVIKISESLKWKVYKNYEVVIPAKYEKNSMLKVICVGTIVNIGDSGHRVNSYQAIGLSNNNEKSLKPDDYISEGESIIGEITRQNLEQILKINMLELFEKLDRVKFLKKISIFRALSLESIKVLSEGMKKFRCLSGEILFKIGSDASTLFVVKSGKIEIYCSTKTLRYVGAFETFGERCIGECKRSAHAKCLEDSEIFIIHKDLLLTLPEIKFLQEELKRKKYYQRDVNIFEMSIKGELASSIEGRKKYWIKDKNEKLSYDLVIVPKNILSSIQDCYDLAFERKIMLELEHRQIVKLVTTKFDSDRAYFVTEHIQGKSLRELMPLDENYLKFFTLYLVSVLEYLHDKDIVYRNMCTDNISINTKGLPFIQDFSQAKIINGRTYTRVGNPFYRAPEMILGRGYTKSVDYWSLGVVLFELAYGCLPFSIKNNDDPVVAYEKILHVKHGTTKNKSEEFNSMLMKLMCENDKRYNCENVRKCNWMHSLDWDSVNTSSSEGFESKKFKIIKSKPQFKHKNHLTVQDVINVIYMQKRNLISIDPEVNSFNWDKHF
ncbi:hypothetical protein SteCoe_18327 [Stentor coeruleus]|uniref:cGMP-dependent protein kinase n=1 Tax=Stentor coeruleus TaxID=5963 RepID=A0A1R2BWU7_9CILI|nr:hypothetical protein SteCoe_18327 [Stentor coeruleus]